MVIRRAAARRLAAPVVSRAKVGDRGLDRGSHIPPPVNLPQEVAKRRDAVDRQVCPIAALGRGGWVRDRRRWVIGARGPPSGGRTDVAVVAVCIVCIVIICIVPAGWLAGPPTVIPSVTPSASDGSRSMPGQHRGGSGGGP